jgi:hypothetical protein
MRAVTALALMTLVCALASAAGGKQGATIGADKGRVDWDRGVVTATGMGVISTQEPSEAKAYLKARGYAKLDALRNLLMLIDHVRIDATTTGADFEAVDQIHATVNGIVRGAQVVDERRVPMGNDTIIEVTVSCPLFGRRSVASAFVPELQRRAATLPAPVAPTLPHVALPQVTAPAIRIHTPPHGLIAGNTKFTALVVDARGLQVSRSMAPKIRREDGREVWGSVNVDSDWVIENGIVVYVHTPEEAFAHKRAGSNPLIVQAVSRAPGAFDTDVVLTEDDAETVLAANRAHRFMDKYNVIWIVDEGK